MTHLKSNKLTELETIIKRLQDKKIPYLIKVRNNKIILLDTKDEGLIIYAKNNNPDLKTHKSIK